MPESENSWIIDERIDFMETQHTELERKDQHIQALSSSVQKLESTVQMQSSKIAEQSETKRSPNEWIGMLSESDEQLRNAEAKIREAKCTEDRAKVLILNADREREKAESLQREYLRLCDQKEEIESESAGKLAEYWKTPDRTQHKKEETLKRKFQGKVLCNNIALKRWVYTAPL